MKSLNDSLREEFYKILKEKNFQEAYNMVKQERPIIRIRNVFINQLKSYNII